MDEESEKIPGVLWLVWNWCQGGIKGMSCREITMMLQACTRRKVEDE